MTYRTASYAEAQRNAGNAGSAASKPDEKVAPQYKGASTKSQAFFRKMGESHAEAERLRQQCRSAANASAARKEEEKVGLQHIEGTIAQARNTSSFAKSATVKDTSTMNLGAGAPMWLGHLADPKYFEQKEPLQQAAVPSLQDAPQASEAQGLAPGAAEPYQAPRGDYSQQIQEVLKSEQQSPGNRTPSKQQQQQDKELERPFSGGTESSAPEAASAPDAQGYATPEARGIREETQNASGRQSADESLGSEKPVSSEDESLSEYEDSEATDAWPPSPPLLRFKMRMQFSSRFKPKDEKDKGDEIKKATAALEERILEADGHYKKIEDKTLTWINMVFHMNIQTEYEFQVGFPIIMITLLDAIYPKRVHWREVDWRFQYKRALQKNFAVLEGIWSEVNMDKAREFRVENTPLRLENLPSYSISEKLEFLGLMKRWYDQRIHHAGPYDPMLKRLEFVEQCKHWGNKVKFPTWIKFEKEHKVQISEMDAEERHKIQEYQKMPEYKRLIWFLGCQEYQTM